MQFTNAVVIARRPDEVFAFLAQFENLPLWNHAISETWRVGPEPVRVGTRYRQVRTSPTRSVETFEVTELEPHQRVAIRGDLGPFRADVVYELEAVGDATIVTNQMTLQPSGALRLLANTVGARVKSAVAENLDVLRSLLEAGADRPAAAAEQPATAG